MASPFRSAYDNRNDSAMDLRLPSNSSSSPSTHVYTNAVVPSTTGSSRTHVFSSAVAPSTTASSHYLRSNSPTASHSQYGGTRAIAVGNAVMLEQGPWSQENTRLGFTPSSSYWQCGRPTPEPTYDDFNPHGYRPQILEDSLATIQSRLGLPMPDESTADLCSSPTNPPLLWPADSHASASSIVPLSEHSEITLPKCRPGDGNTIYCGQCGVGFNGTWRRGNLNRHVKLKHAKGGQYTCIADNCNRGFARSDARIKHIRNHHPELLSSPLLRRHGHEREPSSPDTVSTSHLDHLSSSWTTQDFATGFTVSPTRRYGSTQPQEVNPDGASWSQDSPRGIVGVKRTSTTETHGSSASSLELTVGQWVPPSSAYENPVVFGAQQQLHREVTVEELPLDARITFGSLYVKLDTDDYSRFCDKSFDRWERVLNQLRRKGSSTYALYSQIVKDLYAVVDAVDSGAIDLNTFGSTHHTSRPHPGQQGSSRGFGGSSHGLGGAGAGSRPGRGSKPDGRKSFKPNAGGGDDARVTKKSRTKKPNEKGVDCPEKKRWLMNRHDPSIPEPQCNGCRETVMSQVRNHLNRGSHDHFTVTQCQTCKTDFVSEEDYNEHVAAQSCDHMPQPRNGILISWARLFMMRYPRDTRIPIPYCDERGWLPHSIWLECRAWLERITPSPFLGLRQGHNAPPRPAPVTVLVNTPPYNAGVNFLLQDAVAPAPIRHLDPDATALWQSATRLASVSSQIPAQRDHFRRQLRGISRGYFRALALAQYYLDPDEIAVLANEAHTAARQVEICHQQQMQQNQTQTQDTPYLTPGNPPSSRAGTSTQPSTQSRRTGSSLAPGSYDTRPSSAYDPADRVYQSPFPPSGYQRPLTSPQTASEGPRYQQHRSLNQHAWLNQQALLDQYAGSPPQQMGSPYQPGSLYGQEPSPYRQALSPHQQVGYQQAGAAYNQPWNFPQSPVNWNQPIQAYSPAYSPDGIVDPSVLSSRDGETGGEEDDPVRRRLWRS